MKASLFFSLCLHLLALILLTKFNSSHRSKHLTQKKFISAHFVSKAALAKTLNSDQIKTNAPPNKKISSFIKKNNKKKYKILDSNKSKIKQAPSLKVMVKDEVFPSLLGINAKKQATLINDNLPTPFYPEEARFKGLEGSVKILLTVSKNGSVEKAKVIKKSHNIFLATSLKFAKKLKFHPATDEFGNNIKSQIIHEIIFKLKS